MPIHTSQSQGGESVDRRDFYRRIAESSDSTVSTSSAEAMIRLIDRLDVEFPTTDIWLLTSHYSLILMDVPTFDAGDWLVTVQGVFGDEHLLSYKMPDAVSPFPRGTEVHTTAIGIEQTIAFIRTAMRESGGWINSTELNR
jgi:hypothetical protein